MSWKSIYLESRVLSAGPVERIAILYEYATLRVQDAREALAANDIAARGQAVSKAIAIIGELDRSLDREAGGEIANNLARLYRYMRERLAAANQRKSDDILSEVQALLNTLGEAWSTISETGGKMMEEDARPGAWASLSTNDPADYRPAEWTF